MWVVLRAYTLSVAECMELSDCKRHRAVTRLLFDWEVFRSDMTSCLTTSRFVGEMNYSLREHDEHVCITLGSDLSHDMGDAM